MSLPIHTGFSERSELTRLKEESLEEVALNLESCYDPDLDPIN